MSSLPSPSPAALVHSELLCKLISAEVQENNGWISFARFMHLALYAPGLGYYSAGLQKFGVDGDFVTAPEISPLFGRCLAKQATQILNAVGGDILELGAGSGKLVVDLLLELSVLECLPERYLILEPSASLRKTQQQRVTDALPAHLAQKVAWLDTLPEKFTGLVIGNEVLDAMPVHLVAHTREAVGTLSELGIGVENRRFVWRDMPLAQGDLLDAVTALNLPEGYLAEINLAAPALVASLAGVLEQGAILLLDYGFPQREYYHPQREHGTLMCHYRHHAHNDPLFYPGLQDITAHVDFTAIAIAAQGNGLSLLGYTSQAQFLIACGITELLAETSPDDVVNYMQQVAAAQKLLSPAEMGELFKVIALGKNIDVPLLGFTQGNQTYKL
ncbi:MAG TPA: SAM-dependent methyltransferase [Methylophilaceae bacterium]